MSSIQKSTPTAGAVIGLAVVVALLAAALIVAVVVISMLLRTKKRKGKSVDTRKNSIIVMHGSGYFYLCLIIHICTCMMTTGSLVPRLPPQLLLLAVKKGL